jgi:hypothetical protein
MNREYEIGKDILLAALVPIKKIEELIKKTMKPIL